MDRVPAPKLRPSWANTFGVGRSISQLLLGPHALNTFCRFLRHIGTFLDFLWGVDTPMGRAPAPRPGPHWANIWGSGEVNIWASIRAPCTNFWRFLRHIGTFLHHLWGVDTPAVRVPKTRPSWANTWQRGRSISQLLLRPHAPNTFWRFPIHIGTFLDYLGGVDTPADRVPVPKTGLSWENEWGVGRSTSQLLLGPHALNTFWRFLRHIESLLDHLGGMDTPAERVSALKTGLSWANARGSGDVNI